MKVTADFVFFWGSKEVFSQHYQPCSFEIGGIVFNSSEQWMMVCKARLFNDVASVKKILASTCPKEQKQLGREVRNFDKKIWEEKAIDFVVEGNVAKFGQNEHMKNILLDTGERVLVEASPYDKIWGIGLSENDSRALDPHQWQGSNWLGIALMKTRDVLRC